MPGERLGHEFRILGPGVLLMPLLVIGVFDALAALSAMAAARVDTVDRVLTSAVEMGMCLGAGLASANLIAAEPMAELHLGIRGGWRRTALWRLGLLTVWSGLLGGAMSVILRATGAWLTGEPFAQSQLVWAAPLLWMTSLGGVLALLFRSRAASAGVVTGVWLAEVIAHDWFNVNAWTHPVYLLATSFARGAPWWLTNRLELLAGSVVLGGVAWALLGNSEAFVGSAQE